MISFRFLISAITLLPVVVLNGCAPKIQPVDNPLEIDRQEYARLFDATVLVLRDYGFRVARQDYRFGVITTEPMRAPTILEPWQTINTTVDQAFASTVNDQRRRVTISLVPAEADPPTTGAPTPYELHAEVIVERLMVPTARLTGSTAGRRIVHQLSSVPVEWQQRGIRATYWRTIGRDPYLEQRLLAGIVRRSLHLPGDPAISVSKQ